MSLSRLSSAPRRFDIAYVRTFHASAKSFNESVLPPTTNQPPRVTRSGTNVKRSEGVTVSHLRPNPESAPALKSRRSGSLGANFTQRLSAKTGFSAEALDAALGGESTINKGATQGNRPQKTSRRATLSTSVSDLSDAELDKLIDSYSLSNETQSPRSPRPRVSKAKPKKQDGPQKARPSSPFKRRPARSSRPLEALDVEKMVNTELTGVQNLRGFSTDEVKSTLVEYINQRNGSVGDKVVGATSGYSSSSSKAKKNVPRSLVRVNDPKHTLSTPSSDIAPTPWAFSVDAVPKRSWAMKTYLANPLPSYTLQNQTAIHARRVFANRMAPPPGGNVAPSSSTAISPLPTLSSLVLRRKELLGTRGLQKFQREALAGDYSRLVLATTKVGSDLVKTAHAAVVSNPTMLLGDRRSLLDQVQKLDTRSTARSTA